jgi:Ras-related GTP-binding protein C/D
MIFVQMLLTLKSVLNYHQNCSLQRVVFQKMSPHETLFRLEPTQGLERAVVDHTPLCRFTVWDFPGDYYGDDDDVFAGFTSLIFVVDAQDEPYDHVLRSFTQAVMRALEVNPNIVIEVFINKVDGELFLSDESKYDCRRDIMTQVTDELSEAGVSPDSVHIRYHLTSIYDHSIYEALSRVVQRLIPQLPTLETLLNVLVNSCSMEKAYLFDVVSKLYISTDPGPVDMQSVELCSDMIDVVLDVSGIYGLGPSQLELSNGGNGIDSGSMGSSDPIETNGNGGPLGKPNRRDGIERPSFNPDELVGTLISQAPAEDLEEEMVDPDSAYDSESASVIQLSNGMVSMVSVTLLANVLFRRWYTARLHSYHVESFIGSISKRGGYDACTRMFNPWRPLSKEEFDQLQYRLFEEGVAGSCPTLSRKRNLK